jgi:TRAP-type C4-dicarboxylate transport system permease large subunit
VAKGFDPIHFGIIMIANLEIGYLTPPVGLNLIVAMAAFKESFGTSSARQSCRSSPSCWSGW